jgi:FMN-dependent NADH-azoreductase
MGFSEVEVVTISGVNMYPDKIEQLTSESQKKVKNIVKEWYSY